MVREIEELNSLTYNNIKKIYEKMQEIHRQFCDYPCFTLLDVVILLTKNPIIEREGTTVKLIYGEKALVFGNVSFDHFISSLNAIFDP